MKALSPIFGKTIGTILLALVLLGFTHTAMAQLNGTYTIGGTSPDFATFSAAVSTLNSSGVNGPVVFNVRTGTYNETITLTDVAGVSATNTVTFRSETGVASNVTLFSSSFSDVVTLHNADYHIFENITIRYTGTSTYNAVELQDDADNVTFSGCVFNGGTSTSNSSALLYVSESTTSLLIDYLVIQNCTFNGTGYGINFSSGTAESVGVEVSGNEFIDCFFKAIYLDDCAAPLVSNNYITSASNANSSYTAIEIANGSGASVICNNEIVSNYIKYGIYINNSDGSSGNEVLVANNMLSIGGSTNAPAGIYINGSDYVNIYFNTVNMHSTSGSFGHAALYFSTSTIADGSVNILNNNFALSNGGSSQVAVYLGSTNTRVDIGTIDYNNYFTPGSSSVAYSSGYQTLASWQSLLSDDANSISIDPLFVSNTDLHTNESALQVGTAIAGLDMDIDGDFRSSPPYIGADEIAAPAVGDDAGVTAMVTPSIPPCSGSIPFEVTVTNYGTNTLTSVTVNWTLNGVPQTPVNATGLSVASTNSVDISLGNATLASNTPYTVVFSTSNPNGATDANSGNDSFSPATFSTSLSGTYTIGGTTPDFASFTDAVNALQSYGVCGPVVMNVRQGTYTEQLVIGPILNASATNTVTFQADPANSAAAILEYNSQLFATNYVVNFNEAAYLRFYDLTIRTTTTGSYRTVLKFENNNTDIVFDGNVLESTVPNSNATNYAVVFMEDNNDTYDNGIVFNDNEILHGSYGLYFDGYTNDYETGNIVTNNIISGFYSTGVYAGYQNGVQIEGNTIRQGATSASTAVGIYLFNVQGSISIQGNDIEIASSTNSTGIEASVMEGTLSNRALIANNFITAMGTGSVEGILLGSGSSYIDFVANNLYVNGTNWSSTRSIYTNGASNVRMYSNNIQNDGVGYAIYTNISSIVDADYNNYYYNASGNYFAYRSAYQNTLADWQSASGFDGNSVSVDPLYTSLSSPFDLHIGEGSLAGAGSTYAGITTDIDGDARTAPPTIGADEITPTGCVVAIANNTITGGGSFCEEAPAASITGSSPTGGSGSYTYQWEVSSDGVNYTSAGSSQNQSYTSLTSDTWYRRIVTSGTCADTSNVVTFAVTPPIANNTISGTGTYCDEIPAGTVTGASPTGGSGSYTYQWMESTDGTNYTNVPSGGNAIDYVHGVIANSIWYQRVVTSGQCTDTSTPAILTIKTGYMWTGDINTNWHVPANWDCGDVPDYTKDVFIPAAATNQPEILVDSIGECKTIILENGSSLIIRSAGRLNVEN